MEAYLLEEIAHLRRIIRSHEKSCLTDSTKVGNDSIPVEESTKKAIVRKINSIKSMDRHKSMIFVNPNKFNDIQQDKQLFNVGKSKNQHLVDHSRSTSKGSVKMFINPNFRKPTNVSSRQDGIDLHIHKESNDEAMTTNKSNSLCSSFASSLQKLPSKQRRLKQENLLKSQTSELLSQTSTTFTNHRIFINPGFSKSENLKSFPVPVGLPSPNLLEDKKNNIDEDKDESRKTTYIELSKMPSTSNVSLPRCFTRKRAKSVSEFSDVEEIPGSYKRKKINEDDKISGNKIFFNPRFKRVLQFSKADPGSKLCSNTVSKHHSSKHVCEIPLVSRHFQQNAVLEKNLPCQSASILPLTKGYLNVPKDKINNGKQVIAQKERNRRTSFVSLSPTKLVRKGKLRQNIPHSIVRVSNQNVSLSETNLVQSSSIRVPVSSTTEKNKVKRAIPRGYLQCLIPDKISKLRKQSFVNSMTKLVSVTPKSHAITKIRSKNGKSLKIVRRCLQSRKPIPESKIKNLSRYQQKNTYILKQHAVKSALCVIHNKLKKSQYSKVNVHLEKTNQSLNHSKYVYKNKDAPTKKISLKRESLCKRRLSKTKINRSSNSSEKTKLLRSKYKLVRKKLSGTSSGSKKLNKDTEHDAGASTSKRKWKLENRVSKKVYKRGGLTIVNIGGVFYRCSPTSLTRNKLSPKNDSQKQKRGHLLYIRGQKFQLDDKGETLTCLEKKLERKRIDIGGVTFISSSSGTSLTRTNYHTARSILLQAKQKSISLLTRKLKKNNEQCLFLHRFGRCSGKDKGTCTRQHDPKFIAVCKKFVQGLCSDPQCLLSHTISCHNMPTCQHFLAGNCGRDHCPYPHIKVSDNAPLCLDFLKGFCPLGDQCAKRHLEICPSFEKGICSRGKYCPYPHPKTKHTKLIGRFKNLKSKPEIPSEVELVSSSNLRYFEDINLQNEKNIQLKENEKTKEYCISEGEGRSQCLKKRPRLGRLPSFIPLSLDDNCVENDLQHTDSKVIFY